MNGRKTKQLRKQFNAFHGSTYNDSESYKYLWRRFKKTITRRRYK